VLWRHGRAISRAQLLGAIHALAATLPKRRFALNLCQRRCDFIVGLFAAAARGQTLLLPPNHAPAALAEIQAAFPDHYTLIDQTTDPLVDLSIDQSIDPCIDRATGQAPSSLIALPAEQTIAMVFTSGSTGRPTAHPKQWGTLLATARLSQRRLLPEGRRYNIVATVPSQHMYGLETTVMLTLASGGAVSDAKPFFPADVVDELAAVPAPRLLVSTPAHLRACLDCGLAFPKLDRVLSATAPLDPALAGAIEQRWQTRVYEIYGCSEAGSMASRRTVESEHWQIYDGARLVQEGGETLYCGDHLPAPVRLSDILVADSPGTFRLLGRAEDLIKVAGKRASLAELTRCLLSVPGVKDAVVFVPQPDVRPAALAVAPGVEREQILSSLARKVDEVFLPRPLLLLDRLPRNETGKLARAALLAALAAHRA
jgi:acyl-coenzyme A synthetase/AMP-(fatty) acid ligase